jgi:D-3-phosphoglycerate dehydrogenase
MTNSKPRIVIPADHPRQIAKSPHLERLKQHGEVTIYRDHPGSLDEQIRRVGDAPVMINSRGHVNWSAEALRQLPHLRFISTCSIGTDAIDLQAARQQGVIVSNIPGRTAPVVAEHALALMLAIARRAAYVTAELKRGIWPSVGNTYLGNKTLGVVGTGSIGCEMIRLSRAIGMQTIAWTFHPSPQRAQELGVEFLELDELLARSDVVSLHVKSTAESRHLIGSRELALMKPGSLLVNTARAAIVDTPALIDALNSGHLGGAAIDVYDREPLPPDNPLLSCEQVVLTPHSADQNPEGVDFLNGGAVDNVIAFIRGAPQNVVT